MRLSAFSSTLFVLATIASALGAAADDFTPQQRSYWALQPIRHPAVPAAVDNVCRNPIDNFIFEKLQAAGLSLSNEAARLTLLRRAVFDLHGLPPTEEQIDEFLADTGPQAYERLIDRLLASPRYGERWARPWLDLVRYGESDGYNQDANRPQAWRYRDYVIRSLNQDTPYDQFIREQIAADELPTPQTGAPVSKARDNHMLAGSSYLRLWPYEYNQRHVPQQWDTILNDLTDVTGQVFLGLTVQCARCHDHKFDPILRRDYFRLQAFFAPIMPRDEIVWDSPDDEQRHREQQAAWETATAEIRGQLAALESPYLGKLRQDKTSLFPKETQRILGLPADQRSPLEAQLGYLTERQFEYTRDEMAKALKGDDRKRWDELQKQLAQYDKIKPEPTPHVMTAGDVGPTPPPTIIPDDGDLADESTHIAPGFLSILDEGPAHLTASEVGTGRRRALAEWLASPQNPLVARVMANRIWQGHFRQGLVATTNDLGTQGTACSHPELLDWLAAEFIVSGWSLKHLHHLMMTSATYRQTAKPRAALMARGGAADPENKLLWRMRGGRLEAEAVRDCLLAVSGHLNGEMQGASVFDELPQGFMDRHAWKPSPHAAERNRRSVYLFAKRNLPHPLMESFDAPDSFQSCPRRMVTTTAPQALMMINGGWSLAQAQSLAGRLLAEDQKFDADAIQRAYRLAFSRAASEEDVQLGLQFVSRQAEVIAQRGDSAKHALPTSDRPLAEIAPATAAAIVDYCHVLLNANELVYVD